MVVCASSEVGSEVHEYETGRTGVGAYFVSAIVPTLGAGDVQKPWWELPPNLSPTLKPRANPRAIPDDGEFARLVPVIGTAK